MIILYIISYNKFKHIDNNLCFRFIWKHKSGKDVEFSILLLLLLLL